MENELIKKALKELKGGLPKPGRCPDEVDLSRFVEGTLDEKESEGIAEHLVSCATCCDYVVSLNKVINFPSEEKLPGVPDEQLRKVCEVCVLVKDKEKRAPSYSIAPGLARITQFMRDLFSFDWVAQPIPVAVRSGALALLVLLVVSTTFLYFQPEGEIGVNMEIIGKTRTIPTRGLPGGKTIEKIIKEGDTLFSDDYCRINFELDQDAYAYVLYHDSSSKLRQLYPDPAIAIPQKTKGNTKYTIPEGENNWFQLDNLSGTETVFVIASREPIRDFNETIDTFQGEGAKEALELFENKATVLQVFSFKHQ